MILQELSPKQLESYRNSTARINIWEGAVRSGKSHSAVIRFLDYLVRGPMGTLIAVGKTNRALKQNFVDPILELLGLDGRYYAGKQELHLYGRTIILIGANDERSETKIRGSTFAGAFVDEVTLVPESFWIMLLSRLSIDGAQLFGTTNPDSPFHWLKKNYIDRGDELDIKTFKFTIEDNPSLTESFKLNLKREHRGLWYKRFIEGQWVLAEGVVYDFFDESIHCIEFAPTTSRYYVCGVDYGTTNPCAFSLVGYDPSQHPNLWVETEYYWDSREKNRQKTDSEYADDLIKFIANYNVKYIVIDPSAASFKAELFKRGITNVMDADNDVLNGIRTVAKFISNGTLKICKSCRNLIKEFGTYSWDEKSARLGIDKPVKANDHCFVAGTLVRTKNGNVPIESICVGDEVLTPKGYRAVVETHANESLVREFSILGVPITCTSGHKFYTANRGWIPASDLIQSDIHCVCLSEGLWPISSSGKGLNIISAYPPRVLGMQAIIERIKEALCSGEVGCIETFGSSILGTFRGDTTFITSTEMPTTMTLAISNVYQLMNTFPSIKSLFLKNRGKIKDFMQPEFDRLQRNGTPLKRALRGIKHMCTDLFQRLGRKDLTSNAGSANSDLKEKSHDSDFVRITVSHSGAGIITLMMSIKSVYSALNLLDQTNIQELDSVRKNVVEKAERTEKVYNITVEDLHVYYVNGVLVLNCLDSVRYAMRYFSTIYDGGGEWDQETYRRWKSEQGWQ